MNPTIRNISNSQQTLRVPWILFEPTPFVFKPPQFEVGKKMNVM